eukprot:scaffold1516_cov266-Prasinococcus_capsulatus_cf.AAC.1
MGLFASNSTLSTTMSGCSRAIWHSCATPPPRAASVRRRTRSPGQWWVGGDGGGDRPRAGPRPPTHLGVQRAARAAPLGIVVYDN